jgi:hypothetical protein
MIDFDRDTAFSERMLDVLGARTKAAIHNVANQNVPGFKRYVVRFEDLLKQAPLAATAAARCQPARIARWSSRWRPSLLRRTRRVPSGRYGWITVEESGLADDAELERLIHRSYELIAGEAPCERPSTKAAKAKTKAGAKTKAMTKTKKKTAAPRRRPRRA